MNKANSKTARKDILEICILAGGLSSRMGRDKAHLRIGGRTFLARIRETAVALNLPVRVIRRDLVPRCGPIGGIYTAFAGNHADAVLFLACDMPNISKPLLRAILERFTTRTKAIFTWDDEGAGFPFILRLGTMPVIEEMLALKRFSIQHLAEKTKAKKFKPPAALRGCLINVNTPEEFKSIAASGKT